MGKHNNRKRFRGHAVRANPMEAEPVFVENGFETNGEIGSDVLSKVSAQLQSASSEDRECGLNILSQLDEATAASAIKNFRLVRVAGPLMVDGNLSVKHSAVGALRNLSLVSAEVCEEMVEQDVMTSLCALLSSYGQDWSPVESSPAQKSEKRKLAAEKIDSKTEIFIESVSLLWNLCEASPLALKIVNEKQILPFLLNHLNLSKFGPEVVTPVLQCVYSMTEDNSEAVNIIRERETSLNFFLERHCQEPSDLHLSILTYGIFFNAAKADGRSGLPEPMLPGLVATIAQILEQDQRKLIHEFSSIAPMDDKDDLEGCVDTSVDQMRRVIDDVVLSQQTSLEILTNICCDESGNDWEEADTSDEDDDAMSTEEANGSTTSSNPVPVLPTIIQEAILSHDVVAKIVSKTSLPAENVVEILKSDRRSENVVKMVESLRSRAFLCLNNLVQALTIDDLGGPENLFITWTTIGKQCFDTSDPIVNNDFMESATSALRAITQKLQDCNAGGFLQALSQGDVEKMLVTGSTSTDVGVRMNVVNIAGNIGLLHVAKIVVAKQPTDPETNANLSAIVNFLVEAATRDVDLRVVAEALDKLIDIFTEDETDAFCVEIGLIPRLKQLLPGLKVKMGLMRRQVKKSDENFGLISMAKNNLTRFIKYKEKRPIVARSNKH